MHRVDPGLIQFVEVCIIRYARRTKLYVGGSEDVSPIVAGRDEAALDAEGGNLFSKTVDHGFQIESVSKIVLRGNSTEGHG